LAATAQPALAQTYTLKKFRFPANAAASGDLGLTRGGTVYAAFQDAQSHNWVLREAVGGAPKRYDLGATGIVLSLAANDAGEFAGTLNYPTTGAFTLVRHRLRTYLPAPFSTIRGLDNTGDIVSLAVNASGKRRYALLRSGATRKVKTYKVPASLDTWPVGANNSFSVVGYYDTRQDQSHYQGFLYRNGVTSAVTGPGQAAALPVAINDAGIIAMASGGNYYLFDGVNFTQIAVPGATGTTLSGLNNAGGAFGTYVAADNVTHGFVYKNGLYTSVDAPAGREVARLLGMDDAGNIVGAWWKSAAYPATPFVATCSGTGC
jgi:hypothetical protein